MYTPIKYTKWNTFISWILNRTWHEPYQNSGLTLCQILSWMIAWLVMSMPESDRSFTHHHIPNCKFSKFTDLIVIQKVIHIALNSRRTRARNVTSKPVSFMQSCRPPRVDDMHASTRHRGSSRSLGRGQWGHATPSGPVKISHKKIAAKGSRIDFMFLAHTPPPPGAGCRWISYCGDGRQTRSRQHMSSLMRCHISHVIHTSFVCRPRRDFMRLQFPKIPS